MSNGKVTIILSIVGLMKKISLYKMSFYPEPYNRNRKKTNVVLDLSNYATKSGLKKLNRCWHTKFAKKADLADLKPDIDKLDIDKLDGCW